MYLLEPLSYMLHSLQGIEQYRGTNLTFNFFYWDVLVIYTMRRVFGS
jgi:hypothetical protein